MTTQTIREEALAGSDEIKELAEQPGPCISIYLPKEGVGTNRQMGAGRLKPRCRKSTRRIGGARETEAFSAAPAETGGYGGEGRALSRSGCFSLP